MPEQRPVGLDVDCMTGAVTRTPLTDDEWAAQKTASARAAEAEKARITADRQFSAAAAAHADPVVRALAKKMGVTP